MEQSKVECRLDDMKWVHFGALLGHRRSESWDSQPSLEQFTQ